MNRHFRFRIWDLENKKMFKWEEIWYHIVGMLDPKNPVKSDETIPYVPFLTMAMLPLQDNKYIVQQSTELKDKNGDYIYEGDILAHSKSECRFVIRFGKYKDLEGFAAFGIYRKKYYITAESQKEEELGMNIYDPANDDLCIMGNIFENPDV